MRAVYALRRAFSIVCGPALSACIATMTSPPPKQRVGGSFTERRSPHVGSTAHGFPRYVAMSRAREDLHLVIPQRFYPMAKTPSATSMFMPGAPASQHKPNLRRVLPAIDIRHRSRRLSASGRAISREPARSLRDRRGQARIRRHGCSQRYAAPRRGALRR